jgi:organic radical activating enzyme
MTIDEQFQSGDFLPLVEEFYTLQGEGFHFGKAAYFIRIGGCDIGCQWCDSKLSWNPNIHKRATIEEIVKNAVAVNAHDVVVTGGEPTLYNLDKLCASLHNAGINTYLETTGTNPISGKWDWVCLSPKPQQPPEDEYFSFANELKVIIYDLETDFEWAEQCAVKFSNKNNLFLQPEWSRRNENTPAIVDYIKQHPQWRLSLQTHKYINIP